VLLQCFHAYIFISALTAPLQSLLAGAQGQVTELLPQTPQGSSVLICNHANPKQLIYISEVTQRSQRTPWFPFVLYITYIF